MPIYDYLAAYVIDDARGTIIRDVTGSDPITIQTGDIVAGPYGYAFESNAASEGAEAISSTKLQIQPPLTMVWHGARLGTPTDDASIFAVTHNNSNTTPWLAYSIKFSNTVNNHQLASAWNNAGAFDSKLGSAVLTLNAATQVAMVIDSTNVTLYKDGVDIGSKAAPASIAYGTNPQVAIGGYSPLTRDPNIRTDMAAIWDRALSLDELAILQNNPKTIGRHVRPYSYYRERMKL